MTNKLALLVAVILGGLSVLGIKLYVDKIEEQYRRDERKLPYLVAAHDVGEGEILTQDDIAIQQFNSEVIDAALRNTHIKESDRQSILGRRTRGPIREGQILQTHHFHTQGPGDELKFAKDQRAVTIPVSRTAGVAGMLKPGDYIDIVVTMDLIDPQGNTLQVTRTLFKNVMILATDTNTSPYDTASRGYSTLTLRLRPEECNKLLHCINKGAVVHCLLVQEGTSPTAGFDTVVTDTLYEEVAPEIKPGRRR